MKAWSVFRKSIREQIREPLSLLLTLATAPALIFVYWMFFGGANPTYTVLVLNHDSGVTTAAGETRAYSDELLASIRGFVGDNGQVFLETQLVANREQAQAILSNHKATMLLVIPPDFSLTLKNWSDGQHSSDQALVITGDLGYPPYVLAASVVSAVVDQYVQSETQQARPFQFVEEPLGASSGRSDFELYVPGLLVVAISMLIFQSSMAIVREVEAGTLKRLQLTRASSFDLLAGISATQVLISLLSIVLTFVVALALGFHSAGSIYLAVLVGGLTTLSVVGCGLIVACFARTVSQAFVAANFPLIALMFFSGAAFPIGPVPLFTIAGQTINLFDFLPPTHAVVALNKILGLGAGLPDLGYELGALAILSTVYYAMGIVLFRKTHLSTH